MLVNCPLPLNIILIMLVNVYLHSLPSFLNRFFLTKFALKYYPYQTTSHIVYILPLHYLNSQALLLPPSCQSYLIFSIKSGTYLSKLKIAKITPMFKSDDETDANNYRPISLLSNFNRIFEKIMYKRMASYIKKHILFMISVPIPLP